MYVNSFFISGTISTNAFKLRLLTSSCSRTSSYLSSRYNHMNNNLPLALMSLGASADSGASNTCHPLTNNKRKMTAITTTKLTSSSKNEADTVSTTTTMTKDNDSKAKDNPILMGKNNPLLSSWSSESFNLPPFSEIQPSHFEPAFTIAMETHISDLKAIACNNEPPTFDNVMKAYDTAGRSLSRIASVYGNYCSSLNTDDMQAVQRTMSPILARHRSKAYTLEGLFDKIKAVHESDMGSLTAEQIRLVERVYTDFVRAGAALSKEDAKEYSDISAKLAELTTEFMQNVMKDEEKYELVLTKEELEGCPDGLVAAAKTAATERNVKLPTDTNEPHVKKQKVDESKEQQEELYVITLSRSLVEPFLVYSTRRDLREKAWRAWTDRGSRKLFPKERDNIDVGTDILKLRKRQAELHGARTFAEWQCTDRMAKTPENVMKLTQDVWSRAIKAADFEKTSMEEYIREYGSDIDKALLPENGGQIEPWDWRHYAEKVRIAKYDFDESLLKPYLSLDSVTNAVMSVANKLYGLKYIKREDIHSFHPDVDVYEVRQNLPQEGNSEKDKLIAIFLHDNYARKFKSGGAWMSEYRTQTKNLPPGCDSIESVPIIANSNNFAKGEGGNTLLSFDDANTLFHEFGHGLHGTLSDCTYETLASTNVLTDWVELPSQLMEHWLEQPEVLKQYAKHYQTGDVVPSELLDKMKAAKAFNSGFDTVEYTSCALLDMILHNRESYNAEDGFDLSTFEEEELKKLGMPHGIVMRHRPSHFLHLFASSHYAAGYYVYQWAEVLDADVFAAFKEKGNIFDPELAKLAREKIYSSGNTVAPDQLFREFRGRDPDVQFMLKKKGLVREE